jgi:hypothetical protein
MARRNGHRFPAGRKVHVAVRADIGDPAHSVDVKHDKIGSTGGGDRSRRVNFKLGTGSREGLAHQRAHLALDQIEHHAAHAFVGIVDMLRDLDAAVLADRQDAVVVQQRLGAGFLVRFDDILEQHAFLDFGGNG